MHSTGDIAATTSGQKRLEDLVIDGCDESARSEPNPLLDVWLLPRGSEGQD
jgi:hypothetical protein